MKQNGQYDAGREVFYAPGLSIADELVTLDAEESNHCLRAVRKAKGQSVMLTNGAGVLASCLIVSRENNLCTLKVMHTNEDPPKSWRLDIAVAPTKNADRYEWFAEKATEIGIDGIVPLICRHSERKDIHPGRINRLLVAAMKQSQKAFLPSLAPAVRFDDFVVRHHPGQKFIAFCGDEKRHHLKDILIPGRDALILIGPEGDFSPAEVMLAAENGFIPISLGENRLRTETAALFACMVVNLINE